MSDRAPFGWPYVINTLGESMAQKLPRIVACPCGEGEPVIDEATWESVCSACGAPTLFSSVDWDEVARAMGKGSRRSQA